MFANGESVAEVALQIGISKGTFYNWVNKYPKFREAYAQGQFVCEAWWMQLGRAGAAGRVRNVNATMWIFNMKNRFKWRDRPDPEDVGADEMTPEEFARKAHAALEQMQEADHGGGSAEDFTNVEMVPPKTTH